MNGDGAPFRLAWQPVFRPEAGSRIRPDNEGR
jgi:hypothetical protein